MNNTIHAPLSIVRLEIERLFGRYSYVLPASEFGIYSPFILYGDNGTGKTTLLKLLFHILSPKQKHGHRRFIAQTPFASFSVFLADGKRLLVKRCLVLLNFNCSKELKPLLKRQLKQIIKN